MEGVIKVLTPADKPYYGCSDVMDILGVSRSKAYDIIRKMRAECLSQKLISPAYPEGKIPKRYFNKMCMIEGD